MAEINLCTLIFYSIENSCRKMREKPVSGICIHDICIRLNTNRQNTGSWRCQVYVLTIME